MGAPWEKYGGQTGGGVFSLPPTEEDMRRARREAGIDARADRSETRAAQTAADAAVARQQDFAVKVAEMQAKGFIYDPNTQRFVRDPEWRAPLTAEQRGSLQEAYGKLPDMERRLAELQKQYDANFKGGGVLQSLAEAYAPNWARPENGVFNDTAGTLLSDMAVAKGLTAQQFNTPAEQRMFFEPMIPNSADTDPQIENKLRQMQELLRSGRARLEGQLGVTPGANLRIEQRDPLGATYLDNSGAGRQAAGFMASTETKPVPAGMQAEYTAFMQRWVANPDAGEYVRFRRQLDSKYGYPARADDAYREFATEALGKIRSGQGATISVGLPGTTEPMNAGKIAANALVNNPLTVTAMNAADSASMGALGAFNRAVIPGYSEAADAVNADNPLSALTGQVAGAIVGTKGIGMLGKAAAGRLGATGERLLGTAATPGYMNGTTGQVARNLATDATYGAGVTATGGGNPLEGAAIGGLASLGGQGVGGAVGKLLRGVSAPTARNLTRAGVTLTPGQIMRDSRGALGRAIGGIEDRLAGYPVIGDMIGSARQVGVEDFNRIDMEDAIAGLPKAGDAPTVTQPGTAGYRQADRAVSNTYDNALGPMRVGLDDGLNSALRNAPDYADAVTMNAPDGMMTGQGFQAAKQILDDELANLRGVPGGYRNMPQVQGLRDALFEAGDRQAPELLTQYRAADEAFNRLVPIRNAVAASTNKGGVYTPAQKGIAARVTDRSSGKRATALGLRPGFDFQQAAQNILPSTVPDSGTAGRLALGGLALGAGGAQSQGWIDPITAAAVALPALAYTKAGQKTLRSLLIGRDGKIGYRLRAAGIATKKANRKGLFGASAVPLLLEQQ